MERMVEAVPDSDYQVLQNFLTHSSWEHRGVMDRTAGNANTWIGTEVGAGRYIDESAFEKKGEKSGALPSKGTGAWVSRTTARSACLARSAVGIG